MDRTERLFLSSMKVNDKIIIISSHCIYLRYASDNDGTISIDELARLMTILGKDPNEADLHRMIEEIDLNADGRIDYDEFVVLMRKPMSKEDSDWELEAAFSVFDKDHSGSISASELKKTMRDLGEALEDEDIDEMIRLADENCDGEISFAGTFFVRHFADLVYRRFVVSRVQGCEDCFYFLCHIIAHCSDQMMMSP